MHFIENFNLSSIIRTKVKHSIKKVDLYDNPIILHPKFIT
jgi:hypothetical protein